MTSMFAKSDRGVVVRVNQRGDEVTLTRSYGIVIENVMGAVIRLVLGEERILCEALVEESSSWHRWSYPIKTYPEWRVQTGPAASNVGCLEQLIAKLRISLNGRL